MTRKRGLAQGRGLDALLGSIRQARDDVTTSQTTANGASLADIPLGQLQRGMYQPRRDIAPDALNDLAESIKRHGVMQPIVVRVLKDDPGRYEIVAGERRWRAAAIAGLTHIPAIIRELPDELAIALALIENIQREDLSPLEQAYALQRFHDEFGMSHQEIADAVGKARATVSNLLRLLSLEDEVKTLLEHGDIDMGHARALLGAPVTEQVNLARHVVAKGLSVRQTEQLVREHLQPVPKMKTTQPDGDIARLMQQLSECLGAKVTIEESAKAGQGRMIIHYYSLEELSGILSAFKLDH